MKKSYSDYKYKYLDDSTIQFKRSEGDSTEMGLIVKEQERTRVNGEEKENYSPWDELIASGLAIEQVDPLYEPSYREKRALRYSQDLSPEGSQATAIGDCIDALIVAVVDGDLTKLNEIKVKIDQIKQDIPKV